MISVNGNILPKGEAFILADDRGLMYGWGVFDTIRLYEGIPFMLEEHLKRLIASAAQLHIQMVDDDMDNLIRQIDTFIRKAEIVNGIMRITLTPGENGVLNMIITSRSINYSIADYQRGFSLKTSTVRRNPYSPLSSIKSLNYLDNILAKEEAVKRGFDEALLLNTQGWLSECSCSNIFFVKNQKLFTPSTNCGLLDGITRKMVIKQLAISLNIELYSGKYRMKDLYAADEVFITNSVLQIMPVKKVNVCMIGEEIVGEVVQKLINEYKNVVDSYLKKYSVGTRNMQLLL